MADPVSKVNGGLINWLGFLMRVIQLPMATSSFRFWQRFRSPARPSRFDAVRHGSALPWIGNFDSETKLIAD